MKMVLFLGVVLVVAAALFAVLMVQAPLTPHHSFSFCAEGLSHCDMIVGRNTF